MATQGAANDEPKKICMLISTIPLAMIAANSWLWTFIDLLSEGEDIYEMQLQMHEEI